MTTPSPLENLRIASPCEASWEAMRGDDRVRHCGLCRLDVYDLSGMTREQAEGLLSRPGERVCVRFYRRADGTVLTEDCPRGLARVRRRLAWIGAGLAACLALSFGVRAAASVPPSPGGAASAWNAEPLRTIRRLLPFSWFPRPAPPVIMGKPCTGVPVMGLPRPPVPPPAPAVRGGDR